VSGRVTGKFPLPEQHLSKVDLPPLTDEFTLDGEAADFLKITEEEETLINDAFTYARLTLSELQQENLVATYPSEQQSVLQIAEFPEEGEALRADLYSALETTLGTNRFERFLDVSEKGLDTGFGYFGNGARTILFEIATLGGNETPQLVINDSWVLRIDDSTWKMIATESFVSEMPTEYADYEAYMPPGFQPAEE